MSRFSLEDLTILLSLHTPRELKLELSTGWAAVAAILRPVAPHEWDLLFIKRATHEQDPWSGHMAFPGGRVDPEDANALAAAIREAREEIGLDLTGCGRLLGQLNDLQAVSRGRRMALVIRPYVFALDHDPVLSPNHEVDELVWIPLATLLSGDGAGTYVYNREGTEIELPCIRFGDYLIWGLTHHMLSELLEMLRRSPDRDGSS